MLYVPSDQVELLKRAKEIVRREGRSLSQLFIQFVREYVRQHEPGNPQLRLDRVLATGETKPEPIKCLHICGQTEQEVWCGKKGGVWIPRETCLRCPWRE